MAISKDLQQKLLAFQKTEITEHHIYLKLAAAAKSKENQQVLERIAGDELEHYQFWRSHSGQEVKPDTWKVWRYYLISRLLGFTFGVKLMEKGEEAAQVNYELVRPQVPEVDRLIRAENEHENAVLGLLDEPALRYTGSIVLGLNDALVELTGALAGLTLALQDPRLVALTGSVTGVAAALSMATSEYLSTKAESTGENMAKSPLRAAAYTGVAYIATVLVLILPFLVLHNLYASLACTLVAALLIIACFNYYIAVAKDVPFKRRFLEMAGLSLSVAAISFVVGYVIRSLLGVDGG